MAKIFVVQIRLDFSPLEHSKELDLYWCSFRAFYLRKYV
jgi:hypothetical protein